LARAILEEMTFAVADTERSSLDAGGADEPPFASVAQVAAPKGGDWVRSALQKAQGSTGPERTQTGCGTERKTTGQNRTKIFPVLSFLFTLALKCGRK
jgi:hypothetical protein